ncbi:nucleotide exchange factor GrpE [Sediminivirga luteola]|uniref:nucleotide exchange factor GrpE n=1 Tax=Sediminivirga luteola TaxID=1774748 RepID=UPI001F58C592|nr:nucleotide exchange factor GrpE [Sediminivirga luteola]MCI2265174.1 nucleotide exchange factor GrpE [Sediminivirga luteola]
MAEEENGGFSFSDKRRIDPETGQPRPASAGDGGQETSGGQAPDADAAPSGQGGAPSAPSGQGGAPSAGAPAGGSAGGDDSAAPAAPSGPGTAADAPGQAGPDIVPDDVSGLEDLPPAQEEPAAAQDPHAVLAEERLNDLKRINAEYASYRARAARDQEAAKASGVLEVVEALIPVLDEVRLAQENGDVTGPFETHTQKLFEALAKVGVEQYGAPGEEFDPAVHEALMQQPSSEVEVTTISVVMQPGYRLGERVVRAARVGVLAPEDD